MNSWEINPYRIHSAHQVNELMEAKRKRECAKQEERDQRRRMEQATIAMIEEAKRQNELLNAQLVEAQKANEFLVTQAADSARSAKVSQWIAVASLAVAVISVIVTVVF